MLTLLEAVLLALLGGCIHLALVCYEQQKLPSLWQVFGHVAISPAAGYLFRLTKMPNHLNCFFVGFFAIDFIRMLAREYKPGQGGE